MANQNNYDNYPNGYDSRYGTDPRYQAERPQGGTPRPAYPEPSRYSGGQGYGGYRAPGRDAGYPDPYRDGRDGYYREPSRGQAYPDPYRAPRDGYDRGYRDVTIPMRRARPGPPTAIPIRTTTAAAADMTRRALTKWTRPGRPLPKGPGATPLRCAT